MDLYDFGSECAQTYKEECKKYGKVVEISTQQDSSPEYYTDVYVKCSCGGSVGFSLPVN